MALRILESSVFWPAQKVAAESGAQTREASSPGAAPQVVGGVREQDAGVPVVCNKEIEKQEREKGERKETRMKAVQWSRGRNQ